MPLWKPRRRWKESIKMELQEEGCGGLDWIDLAQARDGWRVLANAIMNLWVPQNTAKCLTGWEPVSLSRRSLLRGVSKYVRSNGRRMMQCYCHFHIHTVHLQTFHSRCSKFPPCTATHDAPLLIRDSRQRKQSILEHVCMRFFLCFGPWNMCLKYSRPLHKHPSFYIPVLFL